MRLYLTIAALMLVLLAAHADAETRIYNPLKDLEDQLSSAIKQIEDSEFATQTRNWFNGLFEEIKQSFSK